jgi:hypothetical protein
MPTVSGAVRRAIKLPRTRETLYSLEMDKVLAALICFLPALGITPKLASYQLYELVEAAGPVEQLQPKSSSTPTTNLYVYDYFPGIAERIVVHFSKTAPKQHWWITLETPRIDAVIATNTVDLLETKNTSAMHAFMVEGGMFFGSCLTLDKAKTTMNLYSAGYLQARENPCR